MNRKAASLGLAVLALALFSATNVVLFRGMHERDVLLGRNRCEETMNSLFASLRDHDNFGSAIESSAELRADIVGLGVYAATGSRIYAWGSTPESYSAPAAVHLTDKAPIRYYVENPKKDSFILLLHPFRIPPPPPSGARAEGEGPDPGRSRGIERGEGPDTHSFFFATLKNAEVVYLEIRQAGYWKAQRMRAVAFPLSEVLLAALVVFVRSLILRNGEYRRRIEEQRNLVVLGTAASTLAHEIKNPLLSIRLQSSILEKLCPAEAGRELAIINAEVDRLSALTYRVNDYLREPRGRPTGFDAAEALDEVCVRLAGRPLVKAAAGEAVAVFMDSDRFRSVAENLLCNAIEAGGPADGLSVEVSLKDGEARIDFLDRGAGMEGVDRQRVFDPFYSTKSRGTGIGLAISKRFVEAAHGAIGIGDREGGGCRVRISLPSPAAREEA